MYTSGSSTLLLDPRVSRQMKTQGNAYKKEHHKPNSRFHESSGEFSFLLRGDAGPETALPEESGASDDRARIFFVEYACRGVSPPCPVSWQFRRTIAVRLTALPAAQGFWPFFPDPPYIGGGTGIDHPGTHRGAAEAIGLRQSRGAPCRRSADPRRVGNAPPPTARQPDRATFAGRGLGAYEPATSRIGHLPSGLGSASRLAGR